MHGFDTFAVTRAVAVTYGTRFDHYDYLEGENLLSPRVGLVLTPEAHTRINTLLSLRALAPGAQEFLPPADTGIWLPPQRTFSAAVDGSPLVAERALHLEAGIERDLTATTTLSVRAFSQHVDNQIVTLFTPVTLGHYFVANSGGVVANGYAAGVKTVDRGPCARLGGVFIRSRRTQPARDVRVFRHVHAGAGPTRPRARPRPDDVHRSRGARNIDTGGVPLPPERRLRPRSDSTGGSVVDARFDVQVRQALPFMDFSSAKWEMLVAVRNFFHDAGLDQSIYDELLVVRSPKRVVGGLTLRF